MSDLTRILWTSGLTVIGGTLIFVVGQLLSRFVIEPIHEQRKLIGEIADAVIFYANAYLTSDLTSIDAEERKRLDTAQQRYRQLATLLRSRTHLIPAYSLLEKLKLVRRQTAVRQASSELIGLSNEVFSTSEHRFNSRIRRKERLAELLGLDLSG